MQIEEASHERRKKMKRMEKRHSKLPIKHKSDDDRQRVRVFLPTYTKRGDALPPILQSYERFLFRKTKSKAKHSKRNPESAKEYCSRLNKFFWFLTGGKELTVRGLYLLLGDDRKRNSW